MASHLPNRLTVQGFSLIELMITLAIIGILASVAYPSYTAHIAQGRRADARTQLAAAQLWMETFYSENFTYTQNADGTTSDTLLANQAFNQSPRLPAQAVYRITVTQVNATSYTLSATPVIGGPMANDACGTLTLSNTGRRGSSGTVMTCWN